MFTDLSEIMSNTNYQLNLNFAWNLVSEDVLTSLILSDCKGVGRTLQSKCRNMSEEAHRVLIGQFALKNL
jgi:hypothetical protein